MTEPSPRITADGERHAFGAALDLTAEELKSRLLGTPAMIRPLTVHLSRAVGKHVRAAALLSCAMGHDGRVPGDAVRLASAVELLHLATLVHDDIIDDADRRRGLMALHRRFGVRQAVLCGDYLFCLALELAAAVEQDEGRRSRADRGLPNYMSDILLGELRQDRNTGNFSLSERQYFQIISGKTAALFEASYDAGFLLSDEPAEAREAFKAIGRNTGLIFQLADDCADYEAARKETKKPVLSDLKNGVVTLPLIYALKKDRSLLDRIKGGDRPAALKRAVASSGGLLYTRRKITEYYEETESRIAALPSSPEKKERLGALLVRAAGLRESAGVIAPR